jgi:hypothetical protein
MDWSFGLSLIAIAWSSPALLIAADQAGQGVNHDAAIIRMGKADIFAFGGVGFASVISKEEKDYRLLLSRNSARSAFEVVFALGNPQAKAYALVGLRQVNPKRFMELASSLQTSSMSVETMVGCIMFKRPMSEIVASIRAGAYSGAEIRDVTPHR